MHLKQELKTEVIDEDFSCKWSSIENALTNAINKEQNVVRLANFFNKNYESFHSQPLKLLMDQVEKYVDSVLGSSSAVHKDLKNRTLSEYTYSIRWKYQLIFNIVYHLNDDFKQMKDYILQQITTMHDDQKELIDIRDFQKHLTTELDKMHAQHL